MPLDPENKKRVNIFIAIAFSISWLTALIIFITGGIENSPAIGSVPGLSLAYLLMIGPYMWSPALANMVTRSLTREVKRDFYLTPDLKKSWPYWLIAWFAPAVFIVLGAALFFVIFPQFFDGAFQSIRMQIALSAQDADTVNIPQLLIIQSLFAVLIAPIFNAVATFGEEFGWRAYLLPKLLGLGVKKALIITSLIWGIWHWPLIAMGYNYGRGYLGAPWLGLSMMVCTTLVFGIFIGWLTLRGRSVWPAVIAHGAINGFAAISVLVTKGAPSPLLGPLPIGLIASLPFAAASLWVLLSPSALADIEIKEIRQRG